MGKQTKRERKFQASGGVKGRLNVGGSGGGKKKQGGMAVKGKMYRSNKKRKLHDDDHTKKKNDEATTIKDNVNEKRKNNGDDNDADFVSTKNLCGLDVDNFFANFTASHNSSNKNDEVKVLKQDDGHENEEKTEKLNLSNKKVKGDESNDDTGKKKKNMKDKQEVVGHDEDNEDDEGEDDDNDDSTDEENNNKNNLKKVKRSSTTTKKRKKSGDDEVDDEAEVDDEDEDDDNDDDDDDSDDDDDNIQNVERKMKEQMAKMRQLDPDFHDFLQENEQSLLDFGQDDDDDDDDDDDQDSDDDDDDDGNKKDRRNKEDKNDAGQKKQLTKDVLSELEIGAFEKHGIKKLKRILGAYRSACHLADINSQGTTSKSSSTTSPRPGESGADYQIDSSEVFDQLMVMCLTRCHDAFRYHLLGSGEDDNDNIDDENREKDVTKEKEKPNNDDDDGKKKDNSMMTDTSSNQKVDDDNDDKPLQPKVLERSDNWIRVKPLIQSFFRSTLHVINEAKEPELISYIVKALRMYIRYLSPFPRIAMNLLKTLISLWSTPLMDDVEKYQIVRIHAFFRIRQLALTQPYPFIEECLKKTYLAYTQRATTSIHHNNMSSSTFMLMGNGLVELYRLDDHTAYQHAFVYIRQLALILRTAMQQKTQSSIQQVYCWQYMHCVKLWVSVLSACVSDDDNDDNGNADDQRPRHSTMMRSLIYPLTEIILGVVRMITKRVRYVPVVFHCTRWLQQLSATSSTFIPTASILLDVLEHKEWTLPTKKIKSRKSSSNSRKGSNAGGLGGIQLQNLIKLSKADPLRTHEQKHAIINELILLMHRELDLYRYSPGYPEYTVRIVQRLTQFCKDVHVGGGGSSSSNNHHWKTMCKGCIELSQRHSEWVLQKRTKLRQAPNEIAQLECLLQPHEKNMKQRHKLLLEKEKSSSSTTPSLFLSSSLSMLSSSTNKSATTTTKTTSKKNAKNEKKTQEDKSEVAAADESSNNRKKQKKKSTEAAVSKNALEEDDVVEEGVDWSDDEDNSDNDDDNDDSMEDNDDDSMEED